MKISKTLTICAFAFSVALAGTSAQAAKVKWKMHSAWGSQVPHLGWEALRFAEDIGKLSDGKFTVKFFEPGALIPANEGFDATSKGSVEMAWSTAGYDVGKYPALAYFTAVPFGPTLGEYMAWIWHHGGAEIRNRVYEKHNIKSMHCLAIGPETSGWFKNEITDLEQLRGLKMRFFGLGARVMQKLGVSTQLLAGGDIFPALEKGVIDATEFSMPAIDLDLGFYQVAKHYYFPGWHQPMSMGELMINLDNWKSLTSTQQEIINAVCRESLLRGLAQGEAIQFPALQELQSKGVTLHRWTPEILAALKTAWDEVVSAEAAADEDFRRVWESLQEFRKGYKIWGDLGYLD